MDNLSQHSWLDNAVAEYEVAHRTSKTWTKDLSTNSCVCVSAADMLQQDGNGVKEFVLTGGFHKLDVNSFIVNFPIAPDHQTEFHLKRTQRIEAIIKNIKAVVFSIENGLSTLVIIGVRPTMLARGRRVFVNANYWTGLNQQVVYDLSKTSKT